MPDKFVAGLVSAGKEFMSEATGQFISKAVVTVMERSEKRVRELVPASLWGRYSKDERFYVTFGYCTIGLGGTPKQVRGAFNKLDGNKLAKLNYGITLALHDEKLKEAMGLLV